MKVGITNTVLSNTGDAAICASIKAILERELTGLAGGAVDVVIFDSNARVMSARYPHWRVVQQLAQAPPSSSRALFILRQVSRIVGLGALSLWPGLFRRVGADRWTCQVGVGRVIAELLTCDVVVSSGGTYLVDQYDFTHRYVELRCAKALGKPVVLWTQSMGPFRTRRARWLARRIARCVDAVYCRDARSAEHWRMATRYDGPLEVVPDAAFAIESPSAVSCSGDAPPRAAVSVRSWGQGVDGAPFDGSAYESMMRAAIVELDELGWESLALSTCQGLPSYAYDDSVVAQRIFSGLDIEVATEFHNASELVATLAGCQLMLATRMHMAILALVARLPVIAIAYEFKTLELFESVGLAHAVVRIEDSSPEWIRQAIRRAVDAPDRYRLTEAELAHLRERAGVPSVAISALVSGATGALG